MIHKDIYVDIIINHTLTINIILLDVIIRSTNAYNIIFMIIHVQNVKIIINRIKLNSVVLWGKLLIVLVILGLITVHYVQLGIL